MISYIVDVRPIYDEVGCTVDIVDTLDLPSITVGDTVFTLTEPLAVDLNLSNAGAGFVVHGTATARVTTSCARCLRDFDQTLTGEVVGFYLRQGEPADGEEEAERVGADGAIDVGPAIMAGLVLEAPFVPLHDPDCKGLCAECGADLNSETCGCEHASTDDHPFSALKTLLDQSKDPADQQQ